jgi:hypothetical protein
MATDSLKVVRISSADQLETLIRDRGRHAHVRAEIRIANFAADELMRWEDAVNRLLQECGCALAAKCTTCATLIVAGVAARNIVIGSPHWPVFFLCGCLSIVGVAIAAKFTAQGIARIRLRRIIAELRELEMPAMGSTRMSAR